MAKQTWQELIWAPTASGTAVANTTTETKIFNNVTIPANYMQDGRMLRGRAFGKLSTTGTPTLIFRLRWGGESGTLLMLSETLTMGSGVSNVNWDLDFHLLTQSNGATGTLLGFGTLRVHTAAGTVLVNVWGVSGHDAPAAVTCDLTADTALSLTATWGTASASNTLTGMMYMGESLN